ncbi:Glyoxysomal fatty acid beta-oxidation multifunctional protein MFP-a [Capsicum chinense]|nr:Glyoxysomal fatty acid beta-oxidation multifunctional protein MFP-a [Capsicum chinense]
MPLLEIVRSQKTSSQVIVDFFDVGKKIKKTPVVVRNCTGFAINRTLFPCTQAALLLVEYGADIYCIDIAFAKVGMAMGPFRVMELTSENIYGTVSSAIMKLPNTNYVAAGSKYDLDSQLKTMSLNFLTQLTHQLRWEICYQGQKDKLKYLRSDRKECPSLHSSRCRHGPDPSLGHDKLGIRARFMVPGCLQNYISFMIIARVQAYDKESCTLLVPNQIEKDVWAFMVRDVCHGQGPGSGRDI